MEEKTADDYAEALFPYAAAATKRVKDSGCRFAYYTSATTAIAVLRGRQVWMRNAQVMNDFTEVEHGVQCLEIALRSSAGVALRESLDQAIPGLANEALTLLGNWFPRFFTDSFFTCLSEHTTEQDKYGRLSMWRAYGGVAGVALVFKGDALFRPSQALAAYTSPVAYMDAEGIAQQISSLAQMLGRRPELLTMAGRVGATAIIFNMLRFAALCTKHPAFDEEREWRVVASPSLQTSPHVQIEIESVGGVPQRVLKLPLKNFPDEGLTGLEPAELIDRVLIGPTEHSGVIRDALVIELQKAGVPDAASKVFQTGIPLRENQR